MDDTLLTSSFGLTFTSAAPFALGALVVVCIAAFVRPARKSEHGRETEVSVGLLLREAYEALAARRDVVVRLALIGVGGALVAELLPERQPATTIFSEVTWFAVSSVMIFYMHRAILEEDARAAGFDVERASFLLLAGRGAALALLLVVGAAVLAAPTVGLAAALLTINGMPVVLYEPIASLFGIVAVAAFVWYARFLLTFPATAVGQPNAGLMSMHAKARGLGMPITAAFAISLLVSAIAAVLVGVVATWALSIADPAWLDGATDDELLTGAPDTPETPPLSLWAVALYGAPLGAVSSLFTLFNVAIVSVAYRRWILPEYAPASEAPPA